MKTVKVGDKVRVVENLTGHGFEIGDVVTLLGCDEFEDSYGGVWYMTPDEYEPIAPALIVVGGEYTGYNGHEWKCIHIDGDYAWMNERGDRPSAAYVFKTDGTNICQGGGVWNIKFEPVVETVTVVGSINNGDHKFYMTVDVIDGKPDWSQAKVTPA